MAVMAGITARITAGAMAGTGVMGRALSLAQVQSLSSRNVVWSNDAGPTPTVRSAVNGCKNVTESFAVEFRIFIQSNSSRSPTVYGAFCVS